MFPVDGVAGGKNKKAAMVVIAITFEVETDRSIFDVIGVAGGESGSIAIVLPWWVLCHL